MRQTVYVGHDWYLQRMYGCPNVSVGLTAYIPKTLQADVYALALAYKLQPRCQGGVRYFAGRNGVRCWPKRLNNWRVSMQRK